MVKAKRVAVKIDRTHSCKLILGDRITIKVPEGATQITLQLDPAALDFLRSMFRTTRSSTIAELADVFFNGRPARA